MVNRRHTTPIGGFSLIIALTLIVIALVYAYLRH